MKTLQKYAGAVFLIFSFGLTTGFSGWFASEGVVAGALIMAIMAVMIAAAIILVDWPTIWKPLIKGEK